MKKNIARKLEEKEICPEFGTGQCMGVKPTVMNFLITDGAQCGAYEGILNPDCSRYLKGRKTKYAVKNN